MIVFVRKVHSADKTNFAVDHNRFAVIAEINVGIKDREWLRIEHADFYPCFFKFFHVKMLQVLIRSHMVVNDINIDAIFSFFLHDVQNHTGCLVILDDVKFHENIIFSFFKFLHQSRKELIAVVDDFRVGVILINASSGRVMNELENVPVFSCLIIG